MMMSLRGGNGLPYVSQKIMMAELEDSSNAVVVVVVAMSSITLLNKMKGNVRRNAKEMRSYVI